LFKSRTPRVVKKNTKTHPKAPSPIVGEEFVCYEVEKVLDSKIGDIGRIYYVQWKGYSSVYNSWIEDLPPYFKKYKAMYEDEEYDSDEEESDFSPEYGTDEDEYSSEDSDSSLESDLDDDEVVASEKKAVKKAVKKPIAKNHKTNNKRITPKDEKSSKKYRFISKTLAALAEMVGDEDSD
jgi:hypothetical protein